MTDFLSSLRPWIEDVACDALWGRQQQQHQQQQQQPVVRMGQVVDLLSQEDGGYVVVSDTRVRIPVIVVGSDNIAASSSSSSIFSCFPIGSIVRLTRPYLTTLADVDDESEHNRWPLETDPNTLVFTVEKLEALHYGAVCGVLDSIFVMQSIKVRQVVQYIQQQHSSSSSLLLSLQEYLQKYRVEWGNVSDVVIDDEHNNNDDDLRVVEELFTRIVGEDDDDSSDNESEQDKDKDDGDGDSKAEPNHNNNELFNNGKTNNNNPLSFIVNAIARMGGVDSSTENRDGDLQKQQQEDDNDDNDDDSGKGGHVETQPQNRDDKEKEQDSPKRNEDDDGDKGAGVETQPPYHDDDDDIIIINNKNDENENARPVSATRPQTRERRGKQLQRLSLQFERQQLEELSSSTSKHSSSRFPDDNDDDEDDDDDNEGMGVSNMLRSESPVSSHAPPARATVAEKSRRSSSKRVKPTAAATNNDSDESDDDDDARLETQAPWRAEDESSNKSSRQTAADPPTSINKKRKLPHDMHTIQQPQPHVQRTIDRWRSLMGSQQPNSSMDANGNDQDKNDMDTVANRNPVQGIRQWLNR